MTKGFCQLLHFSMNFRVGRPCTFSSLFPHAIKFVCDCYITQKMCDKAVNVFLHFFVFTPD